jgi:hypothetical protein
MAPLVRRLRRAVHPGRCFVAGAADQNGGREYACPSPHDLPESGQRLTLDAERQIIWLKLLAEFAQVFGKGNVIEIVMTLHIRPERSQLLVDLNKRLPDSGSPGFPAFTDRFRVTIDVDASHAIFDGVGRVFEFFFHSTDERPEKRKRENAPVDPAERRFDFHFVFVRTRRVTDREANGEASGERTDDHRHGIFAKEQFGLFAHQSASAANMFAAAGWRFQNTRFRAASAPDRAVRFRGQRFIIHKFSVFHRTHHSMDRDCAQPCVGRKRYAVTG